MVPNIGEDVFYKGVLHHVQDRDLLSKMCKIGIPDSNDLIWESFWVPFSKITKKEINDG
jgi:hypothetical protein